MRSMILKRVLQIILSFFVIIILDILWFSLVGDIYDAAFEPMKAQFNRELAPNLLAASLSVYFFTALAITFYIMPTTERLDYTLSFLWGGFLGLLIFGINDFTNYMLFIDWPLRIVFMDLCWGFLVFGLTTLIIKAVFSFIDKRRKAI